MQMTANRFEMQDAWGTLFRARDCNNVSRRRLWNFSNSKRICMKNLQYARGWTHKIAKCITKFHANVVGRMDLFWKELMKTKTNTRIKLFDWSTTSMMNALLYAFWYTTRSNIPIKFQFYCRSIKHRLQWIQSVCNNVTDFSSFWA